MPLPTGARIGPYEVTGALGAGGMGEVYRARDTKLHRDVALKILAGAFVADPDRLARFRREAQVLASLNHPNIAAIYGFEDSGAVHALVLELVDGPTLADRIVQGPLPLAEALPLATQIADALEAAHEQGIVHRDLKPANVKVREDGTVKVLDFGLAKALAPAGARATVDAMNSPTLTAPGTQLGMILGTAAYMAPEQAKGRVVDKRADVWAFGVVLYEMLSGRRLFHGDSVVETMGLVATKDPDWAVLPSSTPAAIRRLLARCLTRDPRHRLRDIGEARIALAQPDAAADTAAPRAAAPLASSWGGRALAAALIVLAVAGGWLLGALSSNPTAAPGAPFHAEIVPAPADAFGRHSTGRVFTFTPDGRTLIYASTDPASRTLYRRDRDSDVAVPIAGTEGAHGPFVSPSGTSIGFFADGQMKRVPLAGGTPQTIRDFRAVTAPDRIGIGFSGELGPSREISYGAAWLDDDTIVYGRFLGGLWRVGADGGGAPAPLATTTGDGEIAHRLPHALPGGRAILCTVVRDLINRENSTVEAIDLATGVRTRVMADATDGRFVPGGYLLFARSGALYSARFDPGQFTTLGDPVKISDDVMHAVGGGSPARASGVGQFDISADGMLAVLQGGMIPSPARQLIWVSTGNKIESLPVPAGGILGPRLSPDGSRIAARLSPDVFILGAKDGIATPAVRSAIFPVWHPDGSRLFAALREQTQQNIYSVPLTGGAPALVASSANVLWPSSVSRDGTTLFYVESNPMSSNDIWQVGLSPKIAPVATLATLANESYPMISPNGKWLAYGVGDDTSSEVHVRAFPGSGLDQRISRDGGIAPVWSDDGGSIYYGRLQPGALTLRDIVRVPIDTGGGRISPGSPTIVAVGPFNFSTPVSSFDVTKDGARILTTRNVGPPPQAGTSIRLIVNPNLAGRRGR
jgi:eukaryotic-like serine/threonine-protein kinase